MTRSKVFILGMLVMIAPFVASATADDPAWRGKVDAELAHLAVAAPDTRVTVLVTLHASPAAAPAGASRDAWAAEWARAAAPALDALAAFAAREGERVERAWPAAPAAALTLRAGAVPALAAETLVVRVGADAPDAVTTLGDPELPGDGAGPGFPDMGEERYWMSGYRGEGTRIAVLDTGVDPTHPILLDGASCASRAIDWLDLVNGRDAPYDDHWHGTATAGLAVGTTACGGAYAGLAPEARLMVAKFLSASGSGSFSDAMDALQWAFDNDADVTVNPWGGSCSGGASTVMAFVASLARAGMLSVFSAGGSGPGSGTIGCPGQEHTAITMGAVDRALEPASFSARGPCADGRTCPDLVAVGVSVDAAQPGGGYLNSSGTSWTAPQGASAVALVTQATRDLLGRDPLPAGFDESGMSEVEVRLKKHALDVHDPGPDNATGWGYLALAGILDDLGAPPIPDVRMHAGASPVTIRGGEATTVTITLAQHGEPPSAGTLTVTWDGGPLDEVTLDLAEGDAHAWEYAFDATLPPGAYRVDAAFDYAWTNPVTGETESAVKTARATFTVLRATLAATLDAPGTVMPGEAFPLTLVASNAGNVPASSVAFEARVPAGYAIAHAPGEAAGDAQDVRWELDGLTGGLVVRGAFAGARI